MRRFDEDIQLARRLDDLGQEHIGLSGLTGAVQYPGDRVAARGYLVADDTGSYRFWALTPTPYPIPHDGPVGQLLAAAGRSPMRASHLHFMVSAPGLRTLVTHIFVRGDELLGSDAVFGVKESLVKEFVPHPAGSPPPDSRDLGGRSWASVRFDIFLAAAELDRGQQQRRQR